MEKEVLKEKVILKGKVKLLTGLHIGGTNSAMAIGGPDKLVIRNPISQLPYIPGSSLKGKMRAMLEIAEGTISKTNMGKVKNFVSDDPQSLSCFLYGNSKGDENQRPSRIIVRDGEMVTDPDTIKETDMLYTETKTEVAIDRITSAANPRQFERVPAGIEFNLEMVINVFEETNRDELVNTALRSLMLVQDDYLGGNGSRGYGQVKFIIDEMKSRKMSYYSNKGEEEIDLSSDYSDYLTNFQA
jgi:CRISPR-associated protein Csm3